MIIKLSLGLYILEFSKHLLTTNITKRYMYIWQYKLYKLCNDQTWQISQIIIIIIIIIRWNANISLISLIADPFPLFSSGRILFNKKNPFCLFLFLRFLLIEGITRLVRHLTLIENTSVVPFVILMRVICIENERSLTPDGELN